MVYKEYLKIMPEQIAVSADHINWQSLVKSSPLSPVSVQILFNNQN